MKSLTIFCFLLVSSIAVSQDPIDLSVRHNMKQDGLSMQFTVLDPDKKGVKHHRTDKTYYWYKAQRVIGTQGGSSGQLLHGLFESFYSNKQLCEKGFYCKGLKDGEWNHWRTDGTLITKEHWSNGRLRGTQLFYNEKGEITKTTIIRGRKSQTTTGDSLVEISGQSTEITVFDSLGRKQSVARYKKGLLHGKQETIEGEEKNVTVYREGEIVPAKEKKERNKEKPEAATGEEPKKEGFFQRLKKRFSKKENTEKPPKEKKKKQQQHEDGKQEVKPEKEKKSLFKRKAP